MGINTVEALATQAQAAGLHGAVHIAINAQRGEFYFASYDLAPREIRSVATLHLTTEAEVRQKAATGVLLIWPELEAIFPQGRILVPEAAALGQLAAGRSDFASGEKLEPVYLRETAFVKAAPPRWIPIP
jgi:tRNA A37 threonylcarbamoyladenosine modification protein TsaB